MAVRFSHFYQVLSGIEFVGMFTNHYTANLLKNLPVKIFEDRSVLNGHIAMSLVSRFSSCFGTQNVKRQQ